MNNQICIGLDLGQLSDYTALAVIEETEEQAIIRQLKRFDLHTPYQLIAARAAATYKSIKERHPTRPVTFVADATGVGGAVMEMLRSEGIDELIEVTITGGKSTNWRGSRVTVPKRDLVVAAQVHIQQGKLKAAGRLEHKRTLFDELRNFKMKISRNGHDSYEHWREGDHDDLVLAVCLAMWYMKDAGNIVEGSMGMAWRVSGASTIRKAGHGFGWAD